MRERPWQLFSVAAAALAFITALAASWPWDSRPGDPRWEMIRQRAQTAKVEVERRRQIGQPISKSLLNAEIEMESELATRDDLRAAGSALHDFEELLSIPHRLERRLDEGATR